MIQINPSFSEEGMRESQPRYSPGQIVRHKRYGYRGVIVAVDAHCTATPEWYMRNKSQPDREQPWYHVLVDGSGSCTYPAEENLLPDTSGRPVEHPLLPSFFSGFENGVYARNDTRWPG